MPRFLELALVVPEVGPAEAVPHPIADQDRLCTAVARQLEQRDNEVVCVGSRIHEDRVAGRQIDAVVGDDLGLFPDAGIHAPGSGGGADTPFEWPAAAGVKRRGS